MSQMHYYFDIGNTRLKAWACDGQGRMLASCALGHEQGWDEVLAQLSEGFAAPAAFIGIASVLRAEVNQDLADACRARWGAVPRFARTQAVTAGVRCAYTEPERLGVDRWLAVLAVADGAHAYCAVDCGTATTIDMVSAGREHLGGFILPGLGMLADSLTRNTQRVRVTEELAPGLGFGRSTSEAVINGALLATVGAIEEAMRRLRTLVGGEPRLVLTGGDAPLIAAWLSSPHSVDPELLLTGLQRYFASADIKSPE